MLRPRASLLINRHGLLLKKRSLVQSTSNHVLLSSAQRPPSITCYRRLSTTPEKKMSPSLPSLSEHERRVAEAQALVLKKLQGRGQKQKPQKTTPARTAKTAKSKNKTKKGAVTAPTEKKAETKTKAVKAPTKKKAVVEPREKKVETEATGIKAETTTTLTAEKKAERDPAKTLFSSGDSQPPFPPSKEQTITSNKAVRKKGGSSSRSQLHLVANIIQHWCSRDPSFFEATMKALNLSGLAQHPSSDDDYNSNKNAPNNSDNQNQPLSSLVTQYRRLYYESIADFRNYIEGEPHSLQAIVKELVQAGFGDPAWSKRYRQVRAYESKRFQLQQMILHQENEVQRRQQLLDLANLGQLEALIQQARTSAQAKKKDFLADQEESMPTQFEEGTDIATTTPHQHEEKSILSTVLSTCTSLLTSSSLPTTSMTTTLSPSTTISSSSLVYYDPFQAPSTRLQKRIREKIQTIERLQRDVKENEKGLEALRSKLELLQFPLPLHEYDRAQIAVQNAREILCNELAQQIGARHAELIEQYQRLDAKTDLTKPHEWFSYARLDRRKIIFHSGPTNSGKTYSALQRLKEAERGLYLGPLRLLAAEVYETLTSDGIYTNLFTGQERREIAFSTHAAATVEMADLAKEYEVVVIDEIQMISDETRGAAWTKALLGLRCKEIHVCGGSEARTIVQKIVDSCGDELEVKEYERFSPLMVASQSLAKDPTKSGCYRHVQPGDCVVAFSRNDIFAIKREIESTTGYRCCVIYGKLPPQTRTAQARRFNDPNSGYDILVASDAIGMGLNLNIKRIIFNSIFKFDGEEAVRLSHSEIKQISGRAGRRNSPYPHGEVTCRDPRDLSYIETCLSTEIPQIEKAALLPTGNHIELFSEGLQEYGSLGEDATTLYKILRQFSAMATVKGDFVLGRQPEMQMIAKRLEGIPLALKDAYTMCMSPTTESSVFLLQNFARKLANQEVCGLPSRSVPKVAKSFDDLSYLCNIYADADLFLWLQFKFPPSNAVEQQAALARKETTLAIINQALENTDRLELQHDYIRNATRHRTDWESENVPLDMMAMELESDEIRDAPTTYEEDEADHAYASFAEDRHQARG